MCRYDNWTISDIIIALKTDASPSLITYISKQTPHGKQTQTHTKTATKLKYQPLITAQFFLSDRYDTSKIGRFQWLVPIYCAPLVITTVNKTQPN